MFGGRDPFAEFGAFGGDPFGDRRGSRESGRGNEVARRPEDPFAQMDRMMDGMFGGRGMGGMGGMMSAMQNMPRGGPGGGPGGGYMSSSTMVMSSQMGADGKMHTERFAESTVSDGRARESQQAYANSRTGMDKMGLERQLGERGRKMVKER